MSGLHYRTQTLKRDSRAALGVAELCFSWVLDELPGKLVAAPNVNLKALLMTLGTW
ncbi:hypothetical protein IFO70_22980 [Phormidium tenue FACHB-886]|nr:hypothetical protein [Phormidium tenue FACHB-886]